jgi:nicotinamidase-related amidase
VIQERNDHAMKDNASDLYGAIGAGQRLGFGQRPALICIDLVRGLTDPRSPLALNIDESVEETARLLRAVRRAGFPVFHTTVVYAKGMLDGGWFVRKVPGLRIFEAGSEWSEFDDRVAPIPGEYVIEKRFQSAFFGTVLASCLTKEQVDTLLVAGCCTSGCVRHTVFDSMAHGFRTIVVRECVAGRVKELHEANLMDMGNLNADVVSLAEVIDYLERLTSN